MHKTSTIKACPLCGRVFDKINITINGKTIPVVLRGACPSDKEKLIEFYEKLSTETIYTRFFSIVRYFEPYVEKILSNPAYVIVAERADTGEIIGVAEAIPAEDQTKAEAGIVVLEKFQGRGLGTKIAYTLNKALHENGVKYVYGYIMPENTKAYKLVKKLGGRIKSYYESMLLVEIPVRPIE
ncbi:MAG: GNAT family N-acetyltransferase [Desulfurococcales archaeon]|nr:GNAT family N-acetyltransferase [Desulfurococcales archaeon]